MTLPEFKNFVQSARARNQVAESPPIYSHAPARLDVMGGIADYSGSVVLEATLGLFALSSAFVNDDRQIRVVNSSPQVEGLAPESEVDLEHLIQPDQDYATLREFFQSRPETSWTAYVLGAFPVLARELGFNFDRGATIYLSSNIPLGAGISSSAALEVASMTAICRAYGIEIEGLELARLAQVVENHVVGAPCGIMDQVTSALGRRDQLLALRCQPHEILGFVDVPKRCRFVGINSNVKHSVGGSRYTDTRVAAFMGHKIILNHLSEEGEGGDLCHGYLCNITPGMYQRRFRHLLPRQMRGGEFLKLHGATIDPVTRVEPDRIYRVRSRTEHPIYENHRVQEFIRYLENANQEEGDGHLVKAGRLMYASNWSYDCRCGMGSAETNLLVRLVRTLGPERGFYGAKITGGGSGGTVAVLCRDDTDSDLQHICETYARETGRKAELLGGSMDGALVPQGRIYRGGI